MNIEKISDINDIDDLLNIITGGDLKNEIIAVGIQFSCCSGRIHYDGGVAGDADVGAVMCRKIGIYSDGLDCVMGQEGIIQKGKALPGIGLGVVLQRAQQACHVSSRRGCMVVGTCYFSRAMTGPAIKSFSSALTSSSQYATKFSISSRVNGKDVFAAVVFPAGQNSQSPL